MTETPPHSNESHSAKAPAAVGDKSARAMVELACAMAIHDAVAYLRNTEIVAVAVTGAAEEMMMNGVNVENANATLTAAQASVAAAGVLLGEVSVVVTTILKNYPRD